MRHVALLALPLALAACEPAPKAPDAVCNEKALNAKIEAYSQAAAKLASRDASKLDAAAAERWSAATKAISEKSAELQKRMQADGSAGGAGGTALAEGLCKGYDELLAIVDQAARS